MPRRALFFDRDGVLNRLVLNPATGAFESPHRVEDMVPTPGLGSLLRPFLEDGADLFLISNQPSYAKGKCSLEHLRAVHDALDAHLRTEGVVFRGYYYCYHHPDSVVPSLKGPCACRKPSPKLVLDALAGFGHDPATAWMIGDQDSDIECGRAAGLRTLLLQTPESAAKRGRSYLDLSAPNLAEGLALLTQAPWHP